MSIEHNILYYLFTDITSFKIISEKILEPEIFFEEDQRRLNRCRILFSFSIEYYKNYNQCLTREALVKLFEISKLTENKQADLLELYDEISILNKPELSIEFLIDSAKQLYAKHTIRTSLMTASTLYSNNTIDEIVPYLQSTFHTLSRLTDTLSSEASVKSSVGNRLEAYQIAKNEPGVLTGFPSLDKASNGLYPGQLFLIAAATSEGKSVMLLNIAYNAWKIYHKNVLYITIENYRDDLLRRFDSLAANVSYSKLKNGTLNDSEWRRLHTSLAEQKAKKNIFYVVDRPADCTPDFIEAKINDLKPQHFDLLVIDYLHIMTMPKTQKKLERDQLFGNMAADLRRIGRLKKIPIVSAVQVNREGIKDKSTNYGVQHIALSQFIANYADIIVSLRTTDVKQALASGIVDLEASLIKHRDGPKARFSIKANFEHMIMKEIQVACAENSDGY